MKCNRNVETGWDGPSKSCKPIWDIEETDEASWRAQHAIEQAANRKR